MNKPFTFAKSDSDNEPKGLPSDFLDERESMPDYETDETYLETDDVIDRDFTANRDMGDEHYPDTHIV